MTRLIALLIALAFAVTTPVLAQPKTEPAVKSDNAATAPKKEPLDINSASEDQLKALPGIGDAYARSLGICRSSNPPSSSWSATLKPPRPSREPELRLLHRWLDSWAGLGLLARPAKSLQPAPQPFAYFWFATI